MTIARQFVRALAFVSALAGAGHSEELDCRWFIAATGTVVPVRCADANPHIGPPVPHAVQANTALLGLTLAPPSEELKAQYGIDKNLNGVIVTQVDAHSEAQDRGITRGDVILESNREAVSTPEDMVRSVQSATKDGHTAISLLLVDRQRQTQLISLSL